MDQNPGVSSNLTRQWFGFLSSLSSILTLAIGTGAFLLLIVAYLEHNHVPVERIGLVMSTFSAVQAVLVFLVGRFNHGGHFRLIVVLAMLVQGSGVLLLSTLPLGFLLFLCVSLFGAGLGVLLVVLYASAIRVRPDNIRAGVAIGVYTALVAGGNAIGAYLVGLVTENYGYSTGFLFSGAVILMAILFAVFIPEDEVEPEEELLPGNQPQPVAVEKSEEFLPLWKMGIITAFLMASVMIVFDTLFPIYALRAGLPVSVVGSVVSLKLFMAAGTRPLAGFLLDKFDSLRVFSMGYLGMIVSSFLLPFVGLGIAVYIIAGTIGTSFGAVRVASLTAALENQNKPRVLIRRLSHYRLAMTGGQITGPYIAGLVASILAVSDALIYLSIGYLFVYLVALGLFLRSPLRKIFKQLQNQNTQH